MSSSLAGNGFDIGIEAEDGDHEGALPSLVTIAWENSDDIKSIANFFTLRRGAVAISEAQCITHKVRLYLLRIRSKCNLLLYSKLCPLIDNLGLSNKFLEPTLVLYNLYKDLP